MENVKKMSGIAIFSSILRFGGQEKGGFVVYDLQMSLNENNSRLCWEDQAAMYLLKCATLVQSDLEGLTEKERKLLIGNHERLVRAWNRNGEESLVKKFPVYPNLEIELG